MRKSSMISQKVEEKPSGEVSQVSQVSSWGSLVQAVPAIPPQPDGHHQNEIRHDNSHCLEGTVDKYIDYIHI